MTSPTKFKTRNAALTKARILGAAQQAFAQAGYCQAGIRDIASLAGVSTPLLLRYFGSKAGLFEAALTAAIPLGSILPAERALFAQQLTAAILADRGELDPTAMVLLSTGDARARAIATQVLDKQVIKPLAKWLGAPDAAGRAREILMVSLGFVLCVRQFPLAPANSVNSKKLGRQFAQSLQAIIERGA